MVGKQKTHTPNRCVYEVTMACNLRCRHCGSRAGRARPDELTTSEATDLFKQLAKLGCKRVTLSGGEPTSRPDWPDLIENAARTGMRVSMITNGLNFNDEAARLAKDRGLITVGFSVDGIGRTHDQIRAKTGHFRVVTEAMSSAVKAGISFTIITTLNRLNLGELEELHDFARDRGAYSWQVQPAADMGNMEEHPELCLRSSDLVAIERNVAGLIKRGQQRVAVCNSMGYFGPFERVLRKSHRAPCFKGCAAGTRTLGIESNGNVKGCLSIMAGYNEQGSDFVEGNIRTESLAQIWNRPGAFAYNRDWSIDDLEGFCRECKHAARCRGGCRSNMVASSGGAENKMCVYRALSEEAFNTRRAGQAAAAVLATVLGASTQACWDTEGFDTQIRHDAAANDGDADADADDADMDTDTDTDSDGDADADAYDTDTDSDGDSDADAYDTDVDTDAYDTDVDTDAYDTDVDTDADGDTDKDASVDSGGDASIDSGLDVDMDSGTD